MNATAIIIPAHNEETALPHLLQQLSTRQKSTIIIDDGSTDSTFHIANKSKCHVLKNKQRQGVSQSIREGLEYALQAGFDKAVCIDADGQHDVTFLDLFEKRIQALDKEIEEEATRKAQRSLRKAKTQKEKEMIKKEKEKDKLINDMAKIILEGNKRYLGKELTEKAIENLEQEGGKKDDKKQEEKQ